jgi:ATP-binding cassette subfamily B protein
MYIDGTINIGTIAEFILYVNMLTWRSFPFGVLDGARGGSISKRLEFLKLSQKLKQQY